MTVDRLMADCNVAALDEKGVEVVRGVVDGFLLQGGSYGWDWWVQLTAESRDLIKDCANRLSLERAAVQANLFWSGPQQIADAVSKLDGGKAKLHGLLEESVRRMMEGDKKPGGAA